MAANRTPSDMIVEILVCLPVKTLLRFKSVCKDWYTLINSSLFIQLHLNKSLVFNFRHNRTLFYTNNDYLCVVDDIYRPLKPIKVYWPKDIISNRVCLYTVGSCNDLVCLRVIGRHPLERKVLCFLVCNPSTHTFKFKPSFPFSELQCLKSWDYLSYGFGYDGKHDDYKIVVTSEVWKERVRGDVYIYSFKADSWKCATHTPAEGSSQGSSQSYHPTLGKSVVCLNNTLHYIVRSPTIQDNNDPNCTIARFDLSSETWRNDLNFPVKRPTYVELGVWDDCLYLRLGLDAVSYGPHNVWVMRGCRDEDSWSIKYNIPAKFWKYSLVAASKEGPLRLLFVRKYSDYGSAHQLVWYNPYDATTESFHLEKSSSDSLFRLCITSLVTIPGSSFNYKASQKR